MTQENILVVGVVVVVVELEVVVVELEVVVVVVGVGEKVEWVFAWLYGW